MIVVDAEDRENEGDFICAAEKATPESGQLHDHARPRPALHADPARGLRAAQAGTRWSSRTRRRWAPAFTVPVDHRSTRTGITAAERARTIQAICDPTSKPADFVRPGHLFPLVAKEGGVLRRAGHTEAAVDLARMAGLLPAGVLCEILGPTGDRATASSCMSWPTGTNLPIISIEELIRYRRVREKLVYRKAEAKLPTKYGTGKIIFYGVKYESQQPLVFVLGDPTKVAEPRWCGCTRPASPATCSNRSAATAATSCTWRST